METSGLEKEGIIKSSFRALCKGFFSFFGASICILIVIGFIGFTVNSTTSKSYFTIEPDANYKKDLTALSAPAILKIDISGIIGTGKMTTSDIQSLLNDSRDGVLKNNRVKGILLCIDTPGGSVTDSNGIFQAIKDYKERYKVPVYAYVDGMCASGGMYISSAADKIFASPVSIIGSVGVILGPVFNFQKLMESIGVKAKTIAKGKDKAMLNPFTTWKEGEDESLVTITDYLYSHFVDVVLAARPNMSKEKLINDYGAQVYAAPTALEYGYIDNANATYTTALENLLEACNIKTSDKYQVVQLKSYQPFFSDLVGSRLDGLVIKSFYKLFGINENAYELKDPFLYLYSVN